MIPLSKELLDFFQCSEEQSIELQNELNKKLSSICKPCWELKYCPYGYLVEDFPLPPLLIEEHRKHINYIQKCLQTGRMGEKHDIPMDEERTRLFEELVANIDESNYVKCLSKFEREASCQQFGHLCPAYFVSEINTETKSGRKRSRHIPNATLIRVARRDNNICQVCGRSLLEREMEIDHIIPYSRGGTSEESNLRITCRECNRKKGRKLEYLFR